jgi:hypothetical protein
MARIAPPFKVRAPQLTQVVKKPPARTGSVRVIPADRQDGRL